MKKTLTIFAVLFITATQSLFAGDKSVTPSTIKNSFEEKFGKTINVSWTLLNDVYIGRFTEENENQEVYYSINGEFLASARYISGISLPKLVSNSLSINFPGYTVVQTLEFASETTGTSYYIHMQNDKAELVLRAYTDGETEVLTKSKKIIFSTKKINKK